MQLARLADALRNHIESGLLHPFAVIEVLAYEHSDIPLIPEVAHVGYPGRLLNAKTRLGMVVNADNIMRQLRKVHGIVEDDEI